MELKESLEIQAEIDHPPDWFRDPELGISQGTVIKHDATTTVVMIAGEFGRWVVKRYNTKSRWHGIRRQFQISRARNCWTAAQWLQTGGILTPKRIALIENMRYGLFCRRSYFISEYIESTTLDKALAARAGNTQSLVESAASMVLALRNQGIVHGDLKATNFLVRDADIYLVDLDAARRPTPSKARAGLHKDYKRFMRNWEEDDAILQAFTALVPAPAD